MENIKYNIVEIIDKKKRSNELSREEIDFVINGFVSGNVKDYQMSALMMAILINGMTDRETGDLTQSMISSGDTVDLSHISGIKVDKHSTGGVGDKVSIALVPLLAACGLKVSKMSGRGLGHTGGTLDKLESIPGLTTSLDEGKFVEQIENEGLAIIGQTERLVPADKLMYALRDVTSTVDSIPLIASSIMSKKLAAGSDTILLDVKYGVGAFMPTKESAEELAKAMVAIGAHAGKDTRAIISNMNQPLGRAVGNSLEVIEAIETLKGNGPEDFLSLCIEAGAIILNQAGIAKDKEFAKSLLLNTIKDKSALEKLQLLIYAQGGDIQVIDYYSLLPKAKNVTEIRGYSGYINSINALEIGLLASDLGAGRRTKDDIVNPTVGMILNYKVGDFINKEDSLITVHHESELSKEWLSRLEKAYEFGDQGVLPEDLIYKML